MGKWAPLSIYMHKPYKGVILGCLINDTRVSGPDENSLLYELGMIIGTRRA